MKEKYLEEFREDLKEFHNMTRKFYSGEVSVPEYKSFSGGFGSYAQRGGERSMLRLRLAGGEINKENLKFIADSIEKYNIDLAHFTTCQSLQLHNLTKDTVCSLIEEAFDHGIITRGGGGDFPRNVMCSPLVGVKQEYFDVLPYAKAMADYLLTLIHKVKLPRKLKVAFDSNGKNETHTTFRDLGFVATQEGNFDIYIAGGLGIKPKMGVKVASEIAPNKILAVAKSMVEVFTEFGNYKSRAGSRTRFLQDTLGVEGLTREFQKKLEKNLQDVSLEISPENDAIQKQGGEKQELCHNRVVKQKQKGLYAVLYHPIGGSPRRTFFKELYQLTKDMDEVKLRITPDQGLYIINLTGEEAEKVLTITEDGANTLFERSTACIGAHICQVGIGDSKGLLESCMERVKKENFKDKVLPKIYISGCPSSCSGHQTGILSFRGGKKPTPEGPKFAFAVYLGGYEAMGEETFGEEIGVMIEEDIPKFLVELGKEVEKTGASFEELYKKDRDTIVEIIKKYC